MSDLTPKASRSVDVLSLSPGENEGLYVVGRVASGNGLLRIVGATSLATASTGANTGTAGAGTTATQLTKPTAAANWTAADLVGKWLLVISGGGSAVTPVLRPILSNTTGALTVNAVTGMDATTVFQIVALASKVSRVASDDLLGLHIAGLPTAIELYGLDFSSVYALDSLVQAYDCIDVKVSGCAVSISTAAPAVDIKRCAKVTVEHCRLTNSGDISITDGCRNVVINGCVNAGGGVIKVTDFVRCDVTKLTATSSPSRVLSLVRGVTAFAEASCSSGGATPIYLESLFNFIASGGLLTGSGNTGYGLEIAFAGLYNLTGCTITGTTSDVLFETRACTWALHLGPPYGRVSSGTASAIAQTSPNQTIIYGRVLYDAEVYFAARVLTYAMINPAQAIGLAATGTNKATAYQMPAGTFYSFGTVAAGTGAIFDDASALAGVEKAVANKGANTLTLYAPRGTINGAASYSLAAGTVKKFIINDYGTDEWFSL